ncbi:MAG: MFS transporter [Acidobacteriaceae bacterium]
MGHAILRIASGASGVLIGVYLASLSSTHINIDASFIGILGAVSFAAELLASIPFGLAADAVAPRWLMLSGALTGALAVRIFALAPHASTFFISRALEGIGVAAVTPPLLAHLAQSTTHSASLRARVMSFFELSLLAGLALGGVAGSQFWVHLGLRSFSWLALVYAACGLLLFAGARRGASHGTHAALHGLRQAISNPEIRSLAPVWLCVNAIVGLWLGPTTTFLLTEKPATRQYLDGLFAAAPAHVGWMLLGYAAVFGTGVLAWSFVLPHMQFRNAMRISLIAMPFVCACLFAINHSDAWSPPLRGVVLVLTSLVIMVESGFTPAALAWLAQTLIRSDGKGVAMGIYSVLLGVGAICGSLLAGWLGKAMRFDGLLLGTALLAVLSLILLHGVAANLSQTTEESHEFTEL